MDTHDFYLRPSACHPEFGLRARISRIFASDLMLASRRGAVREARGAVLEARGAVREASRTIYTVLPLLHTHADYHGVIIGVKRTVTPIITP